MSKTPKTPTVAKPKVPTKQSVASAIFAEGYGSIKREFIVQRLISEAGLTANGAATYYQKMKKAADMQASSLVAAQSDSEAAE